MRRFLLVLPLLLVLAPPAAAKPCPSVSNPFAGTEFDGVDLSAVRASGTGCGTARRVALGAQRKALGMTPTSPIRTLKWRGWRVTGDLRPAKDKYYAAKGDAVVRWRF